MQIDENLIMTLLTYAGDAKSTCIHAISLARQGKITEAKEALKEADDSFKEVHKKQTELIGFDEGKGKVKMTLILTHVQDHIMNGMLCRDMAEEFIEVYSRLYEVEL